MGIRLADATKQFTGQHHYKTAPQRCVTNRSGRGQAVCVSMFKKMTENATAAWIGTDGTGGTVSQRREGKSCPHTTKTARTFAASSLSD